MVCCYSTNFLNSKKMKRHESLSYGQSRLQTKMVLKWENANLYPHATGTRFSHHLPSLSHRKTLCTIVHSCVGLRLHYVNGMVIYTPFCCSTLYFVVSIFVRRVQIVKCMQLFWHVCMVIFQHFIHRKYTMFSIKLLF